MTNENALITQADMLPVPKRQLNYIDAIEVIDKLSPAASGSRLFGLTNEQAKMVMLTGYELGMSLTGALRTMYVSQNGQVTLKPKGALALIQSSGLLEKYEWSGDNNSQTVIMKRKGRPERHMTLTIKEAQAAGWKSAAWTATPQNMLRWRIIGWLADLDWTDLLLGLSIADDSWLNVQITPEGDVIEYTEPVKIIEPTPLTKSGKKSEEEIPNYNIPLPKLLELASNDDILEAFNGAYPATPEQVNVTVHKLVQAGKLELPNDNPPNA